MVSENQAYKSGFVGASNFREEEDKTWGGPWPARHYLAHLPVPIPLVPWRENTAASRRELKSGPVVEANPLSSASGCALNPTELGFFPSWGSQARSLPEVRWRHRFLQLGQNCLSHQDKPWGCPAQC